MEQHTSDLDVAWRGVVDDLQPNQRAWLSASEPVTLHESTAIVAVPNDFTRNQLEGRLRAQLEDALSLRFGREIRIAVTVNPALETEMTAGSPDGRRSTSHKADLSTNRHIDSRPVVAAHRRPPEPRRQSARGPPRWRPG